MLRTLWMLFILVILNMVSAGLIMSAVIGAGQSIYWVILLGLLFVPLLYALYVIVMDLVKRDLLDFSGVVTKKTRRGITLTSDTGYKRTFPLSTKWLRSIQLQQKLYIRYFRRTKIVIELKEIR